MSHYQEKRPIKVFISYAHEDRAKVRKLYQYLVDDGMDVWRDKENLIPGHNWEYEIRKAVRKADVIILCISKKFNMAGYRQKEVMWAIDTAMEKPEGEIFLIPARLENCEVPERLSKWQWVDLFEKNGYARLKAALKIRAETIGASLHFKRRRDDTPITETRLSKSKVTEALEKRRNKTLWTPISIFSILVLAVILLIQTWNSSNIEQQVSPTVIPSDKSALLPQITDVPNTETVVLADATSTPWEAISAEDSYRDMVLISGDTFIMGKDTFEFSAYDEGPAHEVFISTYYIDKYEVTNAEYLECVDSGFCQEPNTLNRLYPDPKYANHAVTFVSWDMAVAYCSWRDARLPTEAEWEKAARGPFSYNFPWGNNFDGNALNFCAKECGEDKAHQEFYDTYPLTSPVGAFPTGQSYYGVSDMAGNVSEWVADWYDDEYYSVSPEENPLGPEIGDFRVFRGGAWYHPISKQYLFKRDKRNPETMVNYLGFRCAKDAP